MRDRQLPLPSTASNTNTNASMSTKRVHRRRGRTARLLFCRMPISGSSISGSTPRARLLRSSRGGKSISSRMAWKKDLHEKHGTTLVETFSHERAAGTFASIGNLRRNSAPLRNLSRSRQPRHSPLWKNRAGYRSRHASGGNLPTAFQGCPAVVGK